MKVDGVAIYHCMSRTVNGAALFGQREKEILRKMIRRVADFSGVEILTYCLMNNHFHVLVRIPEASPVPDEELLRRFGVLYPKPTAYQTASILAMKLALEKNDEEAVKIRERLLVRMGDVSAFMKTLKQRFSTWFNKTHDRYGPLWSDRFKSVLVEGQGNALQTMAAYIDLNPVRAGLVEDPKDYRFCGYAEAVADQGGAGRMLKFITCGLYGATDAQALQGYRRLLFGQGSAPVAGAAVIPRKVAARVLEHEDGRLSTSVLLRCKIRYFSEGAVLGSEEFIQSHAAQWMRVSGRKHGIRPREIPSLEPIGLSVLKNVRGPAFF